VLLRIAIAQNVSLHGHLALSTYLRNLARSLASRDDVELFLFVQEGEGIPEVPEDHIVRLKADTYSPLSNYGYAGKLFQALRKVGKTAQFDVIHCLYPNPSVLGSLAFKKFCSPRTKVVYDIRSPWIENSTARLSLNAATAVYKKVAYASEAAFCRGVDGFVFITDGLKEFYEQRLRRVLEPSLRLPSGVDLKTFSPDKAASVRQSYGIAWDDVLIGYVGVLSRERELDMPLQALAAVRSSDKRYKMMLVGDGNDADRLRSVCTKLGLEDHVVMTGRVEHQRIPHYISSFDFGLCHLPDCISFRHSFPMKVLEYAACGVPVIASSISAHQEIADEIPMVLYESEDPGDFAEKILSYSDDGTGNGDGVRSYAWPSIAQHLLQYYRYIINA
jgi:glycosyltransferase involved in cell wall biosynthesis